MLANNPGIQCLISQIFEPGDIWAFLQRSSLNKVALTVAGLLAIDFLSCKWNVIYSCQKSDFGDVLEIILDIYRFCTYVGRCIPFFFINRWKYLDLAVVNIYVLCLSVLFCSLCFEKLEYTFPSYEFNFASVLWDYAFSLTQSRLRPNFLICSLFYFCSSLSFFSVSSVLLFALLLVDFCSLALSLLFGFFGSSFIILKL